MKTVVDLKDVWVYYNEKIVLENVATRGMEVKLEPEIQEFNVVE